MNWLSNVSFRIKMAIPVIVMLVLFSSVTLYNVLLFADQAKANNTLNNRVVPVQENLQDAYRDLYQIIAAGQGLLLADGSPSEIEKQKFEFEDNSHETLPRLESLNGLIDGEILPLSAKNELNTLMAATDKWIAGYKEMFAQPDLAQMLYQDQTQIAMEEFAVIRSSLKSLMNQVELAQEQLRLETASASKRSEIALEVGSVIAIVLGMLLTWWLSGLIVSPICRLNQSMADIASGDADLTRRVETGSNDEIGQLAQNFNAFVESLQLTMRDVVDATGQVRQEMGQFNQTTGNVVSGVTAQQQESEMVAAAINEMRATSESVAQNAQEAADASDAGHREVQASAQVLSDAVVSMEALGEELKEAGVVIANLDQDVTNIASVLDVIRGIAEQTNLLALNAAIEAARAGEQGRGFAVVADEVRALAGKTQSSTGEINAMIERLQQGARDAVAAMQASEARGEQTIEQANQATTSLDEIRRSIGIINEMNSQIATAAFEQTTVSEEVNSSIQRIAESSQQMVHVVRSADDSSNNLAGQCERLDSLVGRFKV